MDLIFDFDWVVVRHGLFFQKDAKSVLRRLQENGHNIKIVTNREAVGCFVARIILWFNGLVIPVVKAGKNGNKANYITRAHLFVDDIEKNVRDVSSVVENSYIFSEKKHPKLPTLSNWNDIDREVRRLLTEEQ